MDFSRKINKDKYTSEDLPEYPARTLAIHVGLKGVQAGSTLGLLLGVPFATYWKKFPVQAAWLKIMAPAPFVGCAVSLMMLAAKHLSTPMDDDGVDDRAFRILNNIGQVTVDRYSMIGGVTGAAFSAVALRNVRPVVAGSATGVMFGVIFYLFESKIKPLF